MAKRVFLIVLDSVGIGEMPDSAEYGDAGSNTVASCAKSEYFSMPNMERYGLFDLEGIKHLKKTCTLPWGAALRIAEASKGKDTTIGHWEISGIESERPLPTFPNGFPEELIQAFEEKTGRKVLCNKPYSGTEVIKDYGKESVETGALIVYTSADSVFQIAAHEAVVPIEELYRYCEIARELCVGEFGVGRVIARPFEGEYPYTRTSRRHDYSVVPPKKTMLNFISEQGKDVWAIGKINDIFVGSGITRSVRTVNNEDGINKTLEWMKEDFEGLCFVNLVDFDMVYGHRNDVEGYAKALSYFDSRLPELVENLKKDDLLIITADHGCDPGTSSTDHSREHVPVIVIGKKVWPGHKGTRYSFADTGKTIMEYLGVTGEIAGESYLKDIMER